MAGDQCELLCLDLPKAEALRKGRLPVADADEAARKAAALGDPTRLMLAAALRDAGELCVCDLAWVAERSPTLVSHHLAALKAGGLARARRDGKMVLYALTPNGEALVSAVLRTEAPLAR